MGRRGRKGKREGRGERGSRMGSRGEGREEGEREEEREDRQGNKEERRETGKEERRGGRKSVEKGKVRAGLGYGWRGEEGGQRISVMWSPGGTDTQPARCTVTVQISRQTYPELVSRSRRLLRLHDEIASKEISKLPFVNGGWDARKDEGKNREVVKEDEKKTHVE